MATNKECNCVYHAVNLIHWADKLSNDSRIERHYGDINIKDSARAPVVIPDILKSKVNKLSDLIYREALEVKNADREFRDACDISALGRIPTSMYEQGMTDLQTVIERQGKDPVAAFRAGQAIVDTVHDATASKKLIKCKD